MIRWRYIKVPLYLFESGLAHMFRDWMCWVKPIMSPIVSDCRRVVQSHVDHNPKQIPNSTVKTPFHSLPPSCRHSLVLEQHRYWYCRSLTPSKMESKIVSKCRMALLLSGGGASLARCCSGWQVGMMRWKSRWVLSDLRYGCIDLWVLHTVTYLKSS